MRRLKDGKIPRKSKYARVDFLNRASHFDVDYAQVLP